MFFDEDTSTVGGGDTDNMGSMTGDDQSGSEESKDAEGTDNV